MVTTTRKLIFVYNADSTLFAQISDGITKILAPNKYQCNLCMLTHGPLSMKEEWRLFLETLPLEKEFLHKDEFKSKFPQLNDTKLPVIFIKEGEKIKVLMTSDEISQQKTILQLKELITGRLAV